MRSNHRSKASYAIAVLASTSSFLYVTWRLMQWRARKRAKITVERVRSLLPEGPLIDVNDPHTRDRIISTAIKRASKWISLSEAKQMAGQVGGISQHKKPILSLKPDYILKPLQTDHRGLRELAFYEALHAASRSSHHHSYSNFLMSITSSSSSSWAAANNTDEEQGESWSRSLRSAIVSIKESVDMLAVATSILLQDAVVMQSEAELSAAWKHVKREADALNKLARFTASYYGLIGQRKVVIENGPSPAPAYGLSPEAHLLLQDLTSNFSKPCVVDLKMGSQTYEPDADVEKRRREYSKYPQQAVLGLRIVGMRFHDPTHPNADETGYVVCSKEQGRSLTTKEDLLELFRTFFTAGMPKIPEVQRSSSALSSTSTTPPPQEEEVRNLVADAAAVVTPLVPPSDVLSTVAEFADTNTTTSTASTAASEQPPSSSSAQAPPAPHRQKRVLRVKSIANLLQQLRGLKRWLETNESTLRFYASSLLLVYEGDVRKTGGEDSGRALLKMIDFGRVRRQAAEDEGYKRGIRTLQQLLTDLLEQDRKQKHYRSPSTSILLNASYYDDDEDDNVEPSTNTNATRNTNDNKEDDSGDER